MLIMKLTENFTYEEMIKTNTGLPNIPNEEQEINLKRLAGRLQLIRDEFKEPIIVTSAFRSRLVNKKVGGASKSDHLYGCAADIKSIDNKKLWDVILKLVKEKKLYCRQLIWEYGNKKCPAWIHLSINNEHNKFKNNQILYIGI